MRRLVGQQPVYVQFIKEWCWKICCQLVLFPRVPMYTLPFATVGTVNFTAFPAAFPVPCVLFHSDFRTRRNTICAAQNQWLPAASLAGILERLSSSRPSGRGQRVIDSRLAQPPLMPEHLTAAWRLSQYGNGVADSLPSGSGNLDVQLGRQRLPFANPPLALELDRRCLEFSSEMRVTSSAARTSRRLFS